jgi:hypothetical protein
VVELWAYDRDPKTPPPGQRPLVPIQSPEALKRNNLLIHPAVVKQHSDCGARLACCNNRVVVGLLVLRRHLQLTRFDCGEGRVVILKDVEVWIEGATNRWFRVKLSARKLTLSSKLSVKRHVETVYLIE